MNRIQNIRKSRDYEITDRINIVIAPCDLTDGAIQQYGDYITNQVLADSLVIGDVATVADDETLDIDGTMVKINISK